MTKLEERILKQLQIYIDEEMSDDDILEAVRNNIDIDEVVADVVSGPNKSGDAMAAIRAGVIEDITDMNFAGEDMFDDEIRDAISEVGTRLFKDEDDTIMDAVRAKASETIISDIENYESDSTDITDIVGVAEWNQMLKDTLQQDGDARERLQEKVTDVVGDIIDNLDEDDVPDNSTLMKLMELDSIIARMGDDPEIINRLKNSIVEVIVSRFENMDYDDFEDSEITLIERSINVPEILSQVLFSDIDMLEKLQTEIKSTIVKIISRNHADIVSTAMEHSPVLVTFVDGLIREVLQNPEVRTMLADRVKSHMSAKSASAFVEAVLTTVMAKIGETVAASILRV